MVPIVLFSIVALAVFLGRWIALRPSRVLARERVERIFAHAARGERREALEIARTGSSPLERVLRVALENGGARRAELKERMEEVGRREVAGLERYVGLLGTIASIEPLLGLLGTVTGMIGVFQGVVSEGVGDPSALASGIWAALITTAAGLSAAIPAFLGWRWLTGHGDALALEMESTSVALLEHVASDGRAPAAPGEAGGDAVPASERAA